MPAEQVGQLELRSATMGRPTGLVEGTPKTGMTEADKAWTPPSLSMTLDIAAGHIKYMANPAQAGRGTRSSINGDISIGMRTALHHVLISLGSTGEPLNDTVATMREVAGVPRIVEPEALYNLWSDEVYAANKPKPRPDTDLSLKVPIDTARAIEDDLRAALARGTNSLTAHFQAAIDLAVAVDQARGGPEIRKVEPDEVERIAQRVEDPHLDGQTVYTLGRDNH